MFKLAQYQLFHATEQENCKISKRKLEDSGHLGTLHAANNKKKGSSRTYQRN